MSTLLVPSIFERHTDVEDNSVFRIFFSWIVGYVVLEPITSLLVLGKKDMTPLTLMTDFVYSSIPFLKSVYVYRYILKKPEYFPSKLEDLPIFYTIYVSLLVTLDIIFMYFTNYSDIRYPLKYLILRYKKGEKISHIIHFVTYGMIWVFLTFLVYTKLRPLECITIIIGSMFLILLLAYPE